MHKGRYTLLAGLTVASLLVAACGGTAATQAPAASEAPAATQAPAASEAPAATEAPAAERGVLKYNAGLDYGGKENLDPVDPSRFMPMIALLFDRLAEPTGNTLVPGPSLATSWEANATGDQWTYNLRTDAKFHDGTPVTSADVAYSIDHWKSGTDSVLASTFAQVEKVDTPDANTVVFNLAAPNFDFPQLTMDYRARVLPKDGLPDVLTTGMGSGPFKLEKLDVGGVSRVVANDDYWGGKPGVAAVEISQIADAQASLQALQSGQSDFGDIPPAQASLFDGNSAYKATQIPSGTWSGFVMRTDQKPFDNVALRQAMRMVVDRQGMLDLVYAGSGTLSCDTAVMPADPYHLKDCPDGGQDIEGAKAKLAEAGYPDGIDVTLYSSDMLPEWNQMAEIYQQEAAKAGIRVKIENSPASGYYTDTWMVQPFVMTNWNERSAPQALNEIYRGGGSWNESYWNVPAFDELIDKAAAEPDAAKHQQYYLDAQKMLHEEGGTIIPFFQNISRISKACVTDIPETGLMQIVWSRINKPVDCN